VGQRKTVFFRVFFYPETRGFVVINIVSIGIMIFLLLFGVGSSIMAELTYQRVRPRANLYRIRVPVEEFGTGRTPVQKELLGLSYNFRHLGRAGNIVSNGAELVQILPTDDDIAPAIEGRLLNYPNPFSISRGDTEIRYRLSKPLDGEIHIYDMLGNLVFKYPFIKNQKGGRSINKLKLTKADFYNFELSAGVYFLLVIHDGQVLGKTKMAIIP